MTATWVAVLLVGAATVAIKASGPVLAAGHRLPGSLSGVLELLAPALLAALVATQTLAGDEAIVVDERAGGLAAAGAAIALRAPVLVTVAAAAAATAALRAFG